MSVYWIPGVSAPGQIAMVGSIIACNVVLVPLLFVAWTGRRSAPLALVPPLLLLSAGPTVPWLEQLWTITASTMRGGLGYSEAAAILRASNAAVWVATWQFSVVALVTGISIAMRRSVGPFSSVQASLYAVVALTWVIVASSMWWFGIRLLVLLAPPTVLAGVGLALAGWRVPTAASGAAPVFVRQAIVAASAGAVGLLLISLKLGYVLTNHADNATINHVGYVADTLTTLFGWGARWAPVVGLASALVAGLPWLFTRWEEPRIARTALGAGVVMAIVGLLVALRVGGAVAVMPSHPYARDNSMLAQVCLPHLSSPQAALTVGVSPPGRTTLFWNGMSRAVDNDALEIALEISSLPSVWPQSGLVVDQQVVVLAAAETPFRWVRPALRGAELAGRNQVGLLVRHHRKPVSISLGFAEPGSEVLILRPGPEGWVGPNGRPAWLLLDTPTPRILVEPDPDTTVQELANVLDRIQNDSAWWPPGEVGDPATATKLDWPEIWIQTVPSPEG